MTRKFLTMIAAGGSAALLAGAYIFQGLGYLPCAMCWWQRYPHFAAVAIGVIAYFVPMTALLYLGALAAAITGGIGVFHVGVEQKWWEGPASCTSSGGLSGLAGGDLLAMDGPMLILCDQVSWELFNISMPGWNAIFSFLLMFVWLKAARTPR